VERGVTDRLMELLGPALPVRYRLEREIGRGGTARVFLARELQPEREVAIKVLDPGIAAMVGPERFLQEVDIASKLSHPHILPVFAAGEAAGLLYYVMPYVAGDNLRARMTREPPLSLREAIEIAREVADALSYAHERAIVHRDIKPENILLQAGHAIVADFGIARAIASTAGSTAITGVGFVVGTPAYMSPEQASGTELVDGRTDIYSLGCVLYEMLAGETPHTGQTADSLIAKKLHLPAPSVALLRSGVPPGVETAITVALARQPADRYGEVGQLRDALGAALTPVGSSAAPQDTVRRSSRDRSTGHIVERAADRAHDAAGRSPRLVATLVIAAIAGVNWLETAADNWFGARNETVQELRHQIAHAMQWMEGQTTFAGHDLASNVAVYGFASSYFFVFPLLMLLIAVALARRPASEAYRLLVAAAAVNYLIALPFYLVFPVPERWSFTESGAVMLSDRWTSGLIEAVRPFSGLDNCFPSFHVSLTVAAVLTCFLYRVRFRWAALAAGGTVLLSTWMLGIHWLADIVAGVAAGVISVALATRLVGRRDRRAERLRAAVSSQLTPVTRVAFALCLCAVGLWRGIAAQAPVSWVSVRYGPDAETRQADDKLRRFLENGAGLSFVTEQPADYRQAIERLVGSGSEQGRYVARVTPYALVAAELLGANVQVLATYVSRATGATTYHAYLVVNRARFAAEPDLDRVWRWLRATSTPATFAYHSEFSTSSYFLPAIYFRNNDFFDMPASTGQSTAIRARRLDGGSSDLVRAVADGRYDIAAVWSGTRAAFEQVDSLAARYGRRVWFVELPTLLPNDLLVASAGLDSAVVARLRASIRGMPPGQIDVGDVLNWRDIGDSVSAREALANLRWLAREAPAAATVEIRRGAVDGRMVPDDVLTAARQAVRLSGLDMANFDPDFHARQDYVWTLEPMHDGAVRIRSRIVGADGDDQQFEISFRSAEELTGRIGELLHSRLNRVRYLWPYRPDPPTVLRDVDFTLPPGARVTVQKIRWQDPHRQDYLEDAPIRASVLRADFYKFELAPSFVDPADAAGFDFNPMSNISYRVVLVRPQTERLLFRVVTVALVVLLLAAGLAAAWELGKGLKADG
jgi:ABC-type phosphate/phosphonate transport system substrate-binding protein/membrane-associated phospholipid phosphatase